MLSLPLDISIFIRALKQFNVNTAWSYLWMRFCLLASLWNVLKYCLNVGHYGDWAVKAEYL